MLSTFTAQLEKFDLVPAHMIASSVGVVLSAWLIQLSNFNRDETKGWRFCFRLLSRTSYAIVAVAMGWSVSFGLEQAWQPWPPFLILVIGMDLKMTASVLAAYFHDPHRATASSQIASV